MIGLMDNWIVGFNYPTIHQSIYPKGKNDDLNAKILHTILATCLIALFSCSEKITDNPLANKQPKTYLWLFPDSTIGVGISRQQLRWWGEDPDGVVRGYLFAFTNSRMNRAPNPDTLRYTWVTRNDSLMQFPLDTLFRYFTVFVRAVDNSFEGLPNQSIVRLTPQPYLDNNRNGSFDAGDQSLTGLLAATDPLGALQAFPIRNTKPTIAFSPNPNNGAALRQPDTTYTVATFAFKGADLDGDNTIAGYRIALNDTTNQANWLTIPLRDTIVTLVVPRARSDAAPPGSGVQVATDVYGGKFLGRRLIGQAPGLRLDAQNIFYVQAKDVAGEFSPTIQMPSGTLRWHVKRPLGKLLLLQDYTRNDAASATATYDSALAAVTGGQFVNVDRMNISFGVNAVDKQAGVLSTMVPPFIDPALINTLLLYDFAFIYTDEFPSIAVLQVAPFTYVQNGGKLLFSTFFTPDFSRFNVGAVLRDFAPIDSVCSVFLPATTIVPGARLIPASYRVQPDSSDLTNVYPRLAFNATPASHIFFMREVYKRTDARVIYRLQRDPSRYRSVDPAGGADTLSPKIAVLDGQRKVIFFSVPVHLLNNRQEGSSLAALFDKMFNGQFSERQKIDRRKF